MSTDETNGNGLSTLSEAEAASGVSKEGVDGSGVSSMEFTGERYVPSIGGQIKYEHLHRYALAAEFAAGKSVLDVASGEGYGAALLARVAASVVGVDISSESVEHAARAYYLQNLDFYVGRCEALPLADSSVEVVTSFETIEHHDRHEEMMSEIKRVLKPGGVLVISSPNRLVYSDEPNYKNPFHVRELYFDEFRRLLSRYFKHTHIYGQRLGLGSFIYQLQDTQAKHYKSYSGGIERLTPAVCSLPAPVYFIAVCSDEPLADQHAANSVYVDADDDLLKPAAPESGADEAQIRQEAELTQVRERDQQIAALNEQIQETEARSQEREAQAQEKEQQIVALNEQLATLNGQLQESERRAQEKDSLIGEKNSQLQASNELLRHQSHLLSEAERARLEQEKLNRDGEERIRQLSKQLEAVERKLHGVVEQLQLKEQQLQREIHRFQAKERLEQELSRRLLEQGQQIREKDEHIRNREKYISDKEAYIQELSSYVREKLADIEGKDRLINEYKRAFEDFGRSGSYRLGRALTWPLRIVKQQLGGPPDTGFHAGGARPAESHPGGDADPPQPEKKKNPENAAGMPPPPLAKADVTPPVAGDAAPLQSGPGTVPHADAASDYLKDVLFDSEWYLQQNPDVAEAGHNPREHYLRLGAREGRAPHPAFDPRFYLKTYPDSAVGCQDPFKHYLTEGWKKGYKPNRKFDPVFYLATYPDIVEAGVEPLTHFLTTGLKEGRVGCPEDICLEPFEADFEIPRQPVALNTPLDPDVKAIAFYLPQFHPIPENDAWWGAGFTEWTNVRRGEPQFEGHYQPHVPTGLGYYDLREPEVLEGQVELARDHGVYGFCFHYYWFAGKILLDLPVRRMLETGKPDFPFCISWANENWTRRWDGQESEILIAQRHSLEDDLAFIRNVESILLHRNYIRVDGKPLLLVYRPSLLPDSKATVAHWRNYFRAQGHGDIYLTAVRSFHDTTPPAIYGFDAAIQFPPHLPPTPITPLVKGKNENFKGSIHDYNQTKRFFIEELYNLNSVVPLYPVVMPSWDNSARRRHNSNVWINESPESYYDWLCKVIKFLRENRPPEERLVFINAWNEWAEGCHLEPDERFGYAWLNATGLALRAEDWRKSMPAPETRSNEVTGMPKNRRLVESPGATI